jgi:hypothetical protein
MSIQKVSNIKTINKGPAPLPGELSPTVYLQTFVEWLQTGGNQPGDVHVVDLRLVWLYAFSLEKDGVVTYGELGKEEGNTHLQTLNLGVAPDRRMFLKGTVTTYQSNDRWGVKPDKNSLTDFKNPFSPEKKRELDITIWLDTGEIILKFKPGPKWTISPKYATASNLLYGTPAGIAPPLPMVMLSLHKNSA